MEIKRTKGEDTVEIDIPREFTIDEVDLFRKKIHLFMEKGGKEIDVNFSNCKFIDSTGLGVLVSVYKKCKDENKLLTISELNHPNVKKVFRLTRLDKVFNIS